MIMIVIMFAMLVVVVIMVMIVFAMLVVVMVVIMVVTRLMGARSGENRTECQSCKFIKHLMVLLRGYP